MRRVPLLVLLLLLVGGAAFLAWRRTSRPDEEERAGSAHDRAASGPRLESGLGAAIPGSSDRTAARGGAPGRPAPKAMLTGKCVDATTGNGVSGVQLFVWPLRSAALRDETTHETRTDARGEFSVGPLSRGEWLVLPWHADFAHEVVARLFQDGAAARPDGLESFQEEARAQGLVADVGEAGARVEIRLQRSAALRGRVVGPRGEPVRDAPIRAHVTAFGTAALVSPELAEHLRGLDLARSGADGRFTITGLPPSVGPSRLGAGHPVLIGVWTTLAPEATSEPIELRLYEPASVEGRVVWSDGTPVAGARVRSRPGPGWILLTHATWSDRPESVADEHGAFRLDRLPPDSMELTASLGSAEGEPLEVKDLQERERRGGVVLVVPKLKLLAGLLVTADGRPLAGETLEATGLDSASNSASTDRSGHFEVEVPPDNTVDLWLVTAGRRVLLASEVHPPQEDLRLIATATPRAAIRVRVTDPRGSPVPVFSLTAWSQARSFRHSVRGRDGEASLDVVGDPPYVVLVDDFMDAARQALPYPPALLEFLAAPEGILSVRLSAVPEFLGWVLDDLDRPVPGARLLVQGRDVALDATGRFRFVSPSPSVDTLSDVELRLPAGYRALEPIGSLRAGRLATIRVTGGGSTVRGRIVFPHGGLERAAGIRIDVEVVPGGGATTSSVETRTDERGAFQVDAVPLGAVLVVTARAEDLAARGLFASRVRWTAGSGDSEIELRAEAGTDVSGRLTGPGVSDLDPAHVRVCLLSSEGFPVSGVRIDQPQPARNSFRLRNVAPGEYTVVLLSGEGCLRGDVLATVRCVTPASAEVVMQVPRHQGTVRGTLEPMPVGEATVTLWHQDGSRFSREVRADEKGRFEFLAVPEDRTYTLVARAGDYDAPRLASQSDVHPGDVVRLQLKAGQWIDGHVVQGPIAITSVWAFGNWSWQPYALDSAKDTFRIGPVVPGSYELYALSAEGLRRLSMPPVAAGARDVVVRLDE